MHGSMRRRTVRLASAGLAVLLPLALTACRATGDDEAEPEPEAEATEAPAEAELQTGPGVTEDTITLGSLLDLTVVFGPLGNSLASGTQLYWELQNEAGGVCDRSVEVDVRDHQYDPQIAAGLYQEMAPNVLGLQSVLGSPIVTALTPSIEEDGMFVGLAAWTSEVLPSPLIWIAGTTYDVEMISALDYLLQNGDIQEGDKIGHIYFEGDFGENGLRGSEYMAQEQGLEIVRQQITAQDTDLSAQVQTLAQEGVAAILVSTGPTQMTSIAGVAASAGLDVPIMSNAPGFTPQILDSPAGDAIEANVHVVSSLAPFFHEESPAVAEAAAAFEEAYPDEVPSQAGFMFGYGQAQITHGLLEQACANNDLTREGLVDAMRQVSDLGTDGMFAGPLDYSDPARPPTNAVYVMEADRSVPGGLTVIDELESEAAAGYEFPS